MLSRLRLLFALPFWVYLGIALVFVYLAELGIQEAGTAGGRRYYVVALVFGVLGIARLLAGPRDRGDSAEMELRRVEEAARLARELPPPTLDEPTADGEAPPAYADDSPIGRLRARRGGGGDDAPG
jgi:hypothetical protein